jgi:hypothetical protein
VLSIPFLIPAFCHIIPIPFFLQCSTVYPTLVLLRTKIRKKSRLCLKVQSVLLYNYTFPYSFYIYLICFKPITVVARSEA